MIVFALFSKSGRARANSWRVRIPLRCDTKAPITLILPKAFKNPKANDKEFWFGKNSYCPIDVDNFLSSPEHFVMFE